MFVGRHVANCVFFFLLFFSKQASGPVVPSSSGATTSVTIDSGSVLRIVKHAYDQYPAQATGQLLGLDEDDVLNVYYSFPFPATISDHDDVEVKAKIIKKYQQEYCEHLKEVNVDSNPIGLYMSVSNGKMFYRSVINNMLQSQITNPESILLVHDVSRSVQAGFCLRAFRLSKYYLAVKKEGKFSSEILEKEGLSYQNMLEELPVNIQNSQLVALYLQNLEKPKDFSNLDISIDPFLEQNIENVFDSVDEFNYDLGNYNYYQRSLDREKSKIMQWQQKRKAENLARQAKGQSLLSTDEYKTLFKLPEEPSRLDKLLVSAQLDLYCNQIEEFGMCVNTKLFAGSKTLEG